MFKQQVSINRKRFFSLILLTLSSLLFFGCKKDDSAGTAEAGSDKSKDTSSERVFAVVTEPFRKGSLTDYIKLDGNIFSTAEVQVFADVAGKIVRQNVRVGDKVSKGTIVARVDPSKPGLNYSSNPVRSSISGTITAVPNDLGAFVSTQTSIVTVGDLNQLKIEAYVPEQYTSYIRKGLTAELSLIAYPGKTFTTTIDEFSPVLSQTTRTMRIELILDKASKEYARVGMFGSLKLALKTKDDVFLVSSSSVVIRQNQTYLFVVEGEAPADSQEAVGEEKGFFSRFKKKKSDEKTTETLPPKKVYLVSKIPVRIGLEIDDMSEIVATGAQALSTINSGSETSQEKGTASGEIRLEEGDRIVAQGQSLLDDGSKVLLLDTN